jgi:hypothetical protein
VREGAVERGRDAVDGEEVGVADRAREGDARLGARGARRMHARQRARVREPARPDEVGSRRRVPAARRDTVARRLRRAALERRSAHAQRPRRAALGDERPAPDARLEQAGGAQVLEAVDDRGPVHVEAFGELARRGEARAGGQLARFDPLAQRRRDLLAQRPFARSIQRELHDDGSCQNGWLGVNHP